MSLLNNSMTDLLVIAQPMGHVKGSDVTHTGIWEVVNAAGNLRMAKGAELDSTGSAGHIRVHLVNDNTSDTQPDAGNRTWYDLELFPTDPGVGPKGAVFDAVDWDNSSSGIYAHVNILF